MRPTPRPVVIDDEAVNLFVDGSSLSTPRRGGIGMAAVVVDAAGHEVIHENRVAGYVSATNNDMELKACIEALQWIRGRYSPVDLHSYRKVIVFSDSRFVVDGFQSAMFNWPRSRWCTRDGNPVMHTELWKQLLHEQQKLGLRLEIRWGKGHSSVNPHNKTADKLAKASAKGPLRPAVAVTRVRRKQSDQSTEAGSVRPQGQRLRIRIITDRWLKTQRMYVYRYEVISPSSPSLHKVDTIFSEHMLHAGHEYSVRLNDDPRSPRIAKVFRELERKPKTARP